MTVPIQIPWDLFQGKVAVWCECLTSGVRRAVLLPRLDPIFAPVEEDPAREIEYARLDWRLVSPTEPDWTRYREMVEKMVRRARLNLRVQRVENVARWVGGRQVAVPQYHLWLYRDPLVSTVIDRLYDELDAEERRNLWRWLLAWTAPAQARNPSLQEDK
jgi:hypothetical protein